VEDKVYHVDKEIFFVLIILFVVRMGVFVLVLMDKLDVVRRELHVLELLLEEEGLVLLVLLQRLVLLLVLLLEQVLLLLLNKDLVKVDIYLVMMGLEDVVLQDHRFILLET
jgi:hypothetical protein